LTGYGFFFGATDGSASFSAKQHCPRSCSLRRRHEGRNSFTSGIVFVLGLSFTLHLIAGTLGIAMAKLKKKRVHLFASRWSGAVPRAKRTNWLSPVWRVCYTY